MIEFAKLLQTECQQVIPESFHEKNRKDKVVYPYLTYQYDVEGLTNHSDDISIECDVFDFNTSYNRVLQTEQDLKNHLNGMKKLTNEIYVRFRFVGSNPVPTGSDMVKRRNVRFSCKIDWRK